MTKKTKTVFAADATTGAIVATKKVPAKKAAKPLTPEQKRIVGALVPTPIPVDLADNAAVVRSTPVNRKAEAKKKPAKPSPIPVEMTFKVGPQQIKNLLSEAMADIEEQFDIPKCPISLDMLRGDKAIMKVLSILVRQQLLYTLSNVDEHGDTIQDLSDAIIRKYRPALEKAEGEAEAIRREQKVDLQVPRKNAEAARHLLREKGLL